MYISNCAICDKPITDETEYLKSDMGLVCSCKCFIATETKTCLICDEPIIDAVIGKDNIKFCSHACADHHNMNYPSELFTAIALGRPIFQ